VLRMPLPLRRAPQEETAGSGGGAQAAWGTAACEGCGAWAQGVAEQAATATQRRWSDLKIGDWDAAWPWHAHRRVHLHFSRPRAAPPLLDAYAAHEALRGGAGVQRGALNVKTSLQGWRPGGVQPGTHCLLTTMFKSAAPTMCNIQT
jgi:hypothetical protein